MIFTITPLYAIPLILIYLVLWIRVTSARSHYNVSIGNSNNDELLLLIRQHGNCFEWASMNLIMMMLAEGHGASNLYLHIAGSLMLIGRVLHPFGLKINNATHILRIIGNSANMLSVLACLIGLGLTFI